jgi:small-conductance mechanosensitive channel
MEQQPEVPAYQPPVASSPTAQPATKNTRKIVALWLLIGPTALIVGSIILYAVANLIMSSIAPATGEELGGQSVVRTIVNILLFLVGAVSVLTWLPGIIVGIILLTTQKKS